VKTAYSPAQLDVLALLFTLVKVGFSYFRLLSVTFGSAHE
jgi:hypothetical protein